VLSGHVGAAAQNGTMERQRGETVEGVSLGVKRSGREGESQDE